MMKRLLVLPLLLAALAGCSGDSSGDGVATAPAPEVKSAEQLPADLSPEARKSAAGAIGNAGMMQNQANDDARVRAMQEMKKQHGGG